MLLVPGPRHSSEGPAHEARSTFAAAGVKCRAIRRLKLGALLGALGFALAGCAMSTALTRDEKTRPLTAGAPILIMEPDVQLFERTAGGLLEPKADWTAKAKDNVGAALTRIFQAKRATTVPYASPEDPALEHRHVQLTKLNERVGATIMTFRSNTTLRLPNKGDSFDWTLGEEARILAGTSNAAYALFVRFNDSYASAGRAAMMAVFTPLGIGLLGGVQIGSASLVDLTTGDVVWFHHLVRLAGDLRTPEGAGETIETLLAGLPF